LSSEPSGEKYKELEVIEKGWLEHYGGVLRYKQKITLYKLSEEGDAIPYKSYIVERQVIRDPSFFRRTFGRFLTWLRPPIPESGF